MYGQVKVSGSGKAILYLHIYSIQTETSHYLSLPQSPSLPQPDTWGQPDAFFRNAEWWGVYCSHSRNALMLL